MRPFAIAAFALVSGTAGSAAATTPLNVFDSFDLATPMGQAETITTAQNGDGHYDYRSSSGHPTGVNLGPLTSNIWVHENATTGEYSFGFIFGKDGNAPSNKAQFRFRIVGSTSTPYIARGDEGSEVNEPEPGVFNGKFSYGSNTDGVMISGLTGTGWTVIIDSVDFGKVDTWYMASGRTADFADDVPLTLGREYRITPTGNAVSSAPVDPNDSDGDLVPDTTDNYPCDGYAGGAIFVPGEDQHAALIFEDQWPEVGDADFNDAVITYNYVLRTDVNGDIVTITATFNALALGGDYANGLGLHLPFPASSVQSITQKVGSGEPQPLVPEADTELTVKLTDNLRDFFGGVSGPINSIPSSALPGSRIQVDIVLSAPADPSIAGEAPFDLYLFRSWDHAHEIHRTPYAGTAGMNGALFNTADDASGGGVNFVDSRGLPFVLNIPVFDMWPQEKVDIAMLFPNIVSWAASGGTLNQDFYATGVVSSAAFTPAPAPSFAPDNDRVDESCLPLPTECQLTASPNMILWLDGNDVDADGTPEGLAEAGLTGNRVDVWRDKSSFHHDMTPITAAHPQLMEAIQNGRAAPQFNIDAILEHRTGLTLSDYTLFAVTSRVTYNGGTRREYMSAGEDRSNNPLDWSTEGGNHQHHRGIAAGLVATGPSVPSAPFSKVAFTQSRISSTSVRVAYYQDGVQTQAASGDWENFQDEIWIGGKVNSDGSHSNRWNGEIAEVMVFDRALSPAEIGELEACLTVRWGL